MAKNMRTEILSWGADVWRYRWLGYVIAVGFCVFGWTMVMMMPNTYEAEGRVYVDESVLSVLFKNQAVEPDIKNDINALQKTLVSRPNLERVAVRTGANLKFRSEGEANAYYGRVERNIKILSSTSSPIIQINYSDNDPAMTRDVIQAFIEILINRSVSESKDNISNANVFIDDQIKVYEQNLHKIDSEVAEFKRQHYDEIPTSSGGPTFAQRLSDAQQNENQVRLAVEDAKAKRAKLEEVLAGISPFLDVDGMAQTVINNPGAARDDPYIGRIVELQRTLDNLKLRYTDQHPDVKATQKLLDDINAQALEAQKKTEEEKSKNPNAPQDPLHSHTPGKRQISNPAYENLHMRIVDVITDIDQNERKLVQATANRERLQRIAETAPGVELLYNDMLREYGVQKAQYDELLKKREQARMSRILGQNSEKFKLRVMDAPRLPTSPSGPQRTLFTIVVLALGIVIGLAVGVVIHFLKAPVTSVEALMEKFDYPTLGEVQRVIFSPEIQRLRRHQLQYAAAMGGLMLLFLGAVAISKRASAPKAPMVPQPQAELVLPAVPEPHHGG